MKLFLTGTTGFIGQHLVRRLESIPHTLRCLVRDLGKARSLLPGVELVQGDLADVESVRRGLAGCEGVIHLANVYSFWERDPRIYRTVNVEGTRRVLEGALEAGVRRVVHVSSVVIFGKPAQVPFTEESRPGPERFSEYARTKYEGDEIAWGLHQAKGLPLVMLYPCSVLGAGDPKASGQYIADLARGRMPARVLEHAVLTWVHVRDVAEAAVQALEREGLEGQHYLIGKHPLAVGALNQLICQVAGISLPRLCLPDFLTLATAAFFTGLSRLIRRPPPWGMSWDQVRTTQVGFRAAGLKAERELGLVYTPIHQAIAETIAELKRTATP